MTFFEYKGSVLGLIGCRAFILNNIHVIFAILMTFFLWKSFMIFQSSAFLFYSLFIIFLFIFIWPAPLFRSLFILSINIFGKTYEAGLRVSSIRKLSSCRTSVSSLLSVLSRKSIKNIFKIIFI